ncbi:RteC domain-containing protein [Aquimarina aggregata]|uniref:RteC domain-containing protein n=1 Tax=Aquimarina aggregata TaxID=1642818 RepID=UPI002492BAFB|nr:RteC domain-containing protein [Aquimarina aggregata]
MRGVIVKRGFKTIADEIKFFKCIKQPPLTNLLFNKTLARLEWHCPKASLKKKERFLKQQLVQCDDFFLEHIDFGQYLQMKAVHLDELYFTRKANANPQFELQFSEIYDLEFNTPRDLTLAKFSAYKQLIKYIHSRLGDLPGEFYRENFSTSKLNWTGNKVDLIELIYAIHSIEVVKRGRIDIKELASTFEAIFDVDLGNYYRKFIEIRARKVHRTKFLDALKENLLRRMDEADS